MEIRGCQSMMTIPGRKMGTLAPTARPVKVSKAGDWYWIPAASANRLVSGASNERMGSVVSEKYETLDWAGVAGVPLPVP